MKLLTLISILSSVDSGFWQLTHLDGACASTPEDFDVCRQNLSFEVIRQADSRDGLLWTSLHKASVTPVCLVTWIHSLRSYWPVSAEQPAYYSADGIFFFSPNSKWILLNSGWLLALNALMYNSHGGYSVEEITINWLKMNCPIYPFSHFSSRNVTAAGCVFKCEAFLCQ